MKTKFGVISFSLIVASFTLWVGCREGQSQAKVPVIANEGASFTEAKAEAEPPPAPVPAKTAEAPVPVVQAEPPSAPPVPPAAPAVPPASIIITKAAITNAAVTNANPAPAPVPAEPPQISPALAEVVRLIQANVGQDVLSAYITNSTQPFHIGANEIVYLQDLGVPSAIVTTLINVDSTPEMQARKQAAAAVKPLPAGVALHTPASGPSAPAVRNPPEPVPVNPPANQGAYTAPPPEGTQVVYDYPQPTTEVSYSYFYSSLSPYGSWVDVPGYGSCWRPTCATWNSSWRPYADNGRWLWSDAGWYWYSDYSWGWAPFHYGRWCQPAGLGWVWRPDTTWGPSWVSWRYSPNYCGWAPLPPAATYVSGLGFYYNSGSVGIGFEFGLSAGDYCYVPSARFCDRRPYDHFVPRHQNQTLHKDTTIINNYVVGNNNTIINNGPGLDRVAKVTRGDVKRVALKDTTAVKNLGTRRERLENDGQTLTVYRPPTATLAHKSVVMPSAQPASATYRPVASVKQGSFAGQSSASSYSAPTGVTSTRSPRTGPTPVTIYPKPVNTANQPVVVTGGTASPAPAYTKPAATRPGGAAYSGTGAPRATTLAPSAGGGRHQTVSSPVGGEGSSKTGSAYTKPSAGVRPYTTLPGTPSSAQSGSVVGAQVSPKSGITTRSGTPRGDFVQPAAPRGSVAPAPRTGYSAPAAVSPSHSSGRVSSPPTYSSPARVGPSHSKVSAPTGGSSSGGRSSSSQGKSSDSGDNKKGR